MSGDKTLIFWPVRSTVEVWDPILQIWEAGPELPTPLYKAQAMVISEFICKWRSLAHVTSTTTNVM